ncbi:MAG: nucleotide disphospho-sugar-binding domain-containing protein [Cyanobacteria bacterium J06627_15]
MAHIVCITGGLTGIFHASLALVQQLTQAGHRVTYASPHDFRQAVTAQGIDYVQLDRWLVQPADPPMSRWQKLLTLQARQQRAVDELGVQSFTQTLQNLEPDLVLIDMEMTPHIMAGVMSGLPMVLLCQFLSIWKRPCLPAISSPIMPAKDRWGRWLRAELSWLRNGFTTWKAAQQQRWVRVGLDRRSIWGCYARQIGYPFSEQSGFTQWLIPFGQGQLPVLCFNASELDFPHEPHPLMHYAGPMVSEARQNSRVTPDTWKILEQRFENRRSRGRTLIYCSCSTFAKGHRQWLSKVIAAVADCPEWDLVVGLGNQLDREQLGTLPPTVYAFGWVPQLEVLKQADCAVVNAGINTINECIDSGVPMLVYSLGHADQNGNAARVAYHGLGLVGDREQDTAGQIRDSIRTLLTEPSYRNCVEQMCDRTRRYRHEQRAAQIVEALLAKQKRSPAKNGSPPRHAQSIP